MANTLLDDEFYSKNNFDIDKSCKHESFATSIEVRRSLPDRSEGKGRPLKMKEISRLLAVMELLRKRISKSMPSQHIALFLAVAENPGITMPELMEFLDMPQGTVSRNVKLLSNYVEREAGVTRRKGYNLLRTQPDPENRQILAVHMTGKGHALLKELAGTLNPHLDDDWEGGYDEGHGEDRSRGIEMH